MLKPFSIKLKNQNYTIPIFPIFILMFFISTDILTTYLASPDLKLEANPIVVYFGRTWTIVWISCVSNLFFHVIAYILSVSYIKNNNITFKDLIKLSNYKNFRLILTVIFYIRFYYYIFFSAFISINNFLIHLWLHTSWKSQVNWYIMLVWDNKIFYDIFHAIGTFFGVIIFIYQVKKSTFRS